jgi:hypothetical protein
VTWENRITFEVSSADPDSDSPVWVDFTLRIRDMVQTVEVNTGRQNDLDQSEPSVFTVLLDNFDDALSYGNTSSPYAAWWGPGRKCRLRDTVAGVVFDIATGYLQTPTEGLVTAGMEHRVSLSIVDRLGRLASSEPFVSTLAAHILGTNPVRDLVAYYPLNDPTGVKAAFPVQVGNAAMPALPPATFGVLLGSTPADFIQFGTGEVPPADDMTPSCRFTYSADGIETSQLQIVLPNPITLASGQFLTMCVWARPERLPVPISAEEIAVMLWNQGVIPDNAQLKLTASLGAPTAWQITFGSSPWGNTFNGPLPATDRWTFAAAHLQLAANQELWIDDSITSSSFGGSPPGSMSFSTLRIGAGWMGALAHVQIYVGSSPANTDFLAQREIALAGLERQTTGERIRAIASYAGVRGGEMNVDTGTSVMARATLAGQTPLDAMRDAERTEQGLLYADGSGLLQFRDRRSLYNI